MATGTDPLIAVEPAGVSVYGVAQHGYSVLEGGVSKATTYDMAIATASLRRSVSIESAMSAASAIVRIKQQKMVDLTDLLALLMQGRAGLPPTSGTSDDKVTVSGLKAKAESVKAKYGVDIYGWKEGRASSGTDEIERQDLEGGLVLLQSAIDENDNQLQQDTLTLQSWVSKRDESFRSASKAMTTILGTGKAVINNIGG